MNIELLDKPVPASAVTTRQQAGQTLSYLEGWYVISKLNEVFGATGWSKSVDSLEVVQSERKGEGDKEKWYVGYVCRVRVMVEGKTSEDVGFGQGIDKDLGRAHESAAKEAVTDALKRCAKDLGWATGLALYDKARAHVAETPVDAKERAAQWLKSLPEMAAVDAYLKDYAKTHGGPRSTYAAECADAGLRSLAEVKGFLEDGAVPSDLARVLAK